MRAESNDLRYVLNRKKIDYVVSAAAVGAYIVESIEFSRGGLLN